MNCILFRLNNELQQKDGAKTPVVWFYIIQILHTTFLHIIHGAFRTSLSMTMQSTTDRRTREGMNRPSIIKPVDNAAANVLCYARSLCILLLVTTVVLRLAGEKCWKWHRFSFCCLLFLVGPRQTFHIRVPIKMFRFTLIPSLFTCLLRLRFLLQILLCCAVFCFVFVLFF